MKMDCLLAIRLYFSSSAFEGSLLNCLFIVALLVLFIYPKKSEQTKDLILQFSVISYKWVPPRTLCNLSSCCSRQMPIKDDCGNYNYPYKLENVFISSVLGN